MLFSSEQPLYCTVLYAHKTTILYYPLLHTSVHQKTKQYCDIAVRYRRRDDITGNVQVIK